MVFVLISALFIVPGNDFTYSDLLNEMVLILSVALAKLYVCFDKLIIWDFILS